MAGPSDARPTPLAVPLLRRDGDALYSVTYGVQLTTWRRRPLFEDAGVRERVDALVRASARAMGCRVACCEVAPATVVAQVEAPPTLSPRAVAVGLRDGVAGPLAEADGMAEAVRQWGGVFVPEYVVTTGEVAETACE